MLKIPAHGPSASSSVPARTARTIRSVAEPLATVRNTMPDRLLPAGDGDL